MPTFTSVKMSKNESAYIPWSGTVPSSSCVSGIISSSMGEPVASSRTRMSVIPGGPSMMNRPVLELAVAQPCFGVALSE